MIHVVNISFHYFLILPFFLCSCGDGSIEYTDQIKTSTTQKNDSASLIELNPSKVIDSAEFVAFRKNIPTLDIGFSMTCLKANDQISYYNGEYPEFITEMGGKVLGKLEEYQGYSFLIMEYPADIPLPYLEVFDPVGENIDGFELHNYLHCADLSAAHQFSSFEIIDSHEIELKSFYDSVGFYELIKLDTLKLVDMIKDK